MSKTDDALVTQLGMLNANMAFLTKVLALNLGKETFLRNKKQKEEQIEYLNENSLPREIIALIIGSTPESVRVTLSQLKPKKKPVESQTQKEK